jgi:pyrimidine operon attenuation protein/uracil phosphoribosyltransferase
MTSTTLPRRAARGRRGLAAAADAIGIPSDELRAALHRGDSIARVAHDHGVLAETVVAALVAECRLRLESDVAAGRISRADADALLEQSTPGFVTLVTGLTLRGAA